MSSPIKCFTCGKVLANLYCEFTDRVRSRKLEKGMQPDAVIYLTGKNMKKTPEGEILDELKIRHPCCRRQLLTNVKIQLY
jgi:DNA-directed RNA polymerase I, II, and III subunit RPABC5